MITIKNKKFCENSRNRFYFVLLLFFLILIFFVRGIDNYFLGDDWFHLNITQISNWQEFLNFFNPLANPQQAAFYRPIPTQLFFFLVQSLFGLKPFYYHLPIYLLYIASIYLFNRLLIILNFSQRSRYISTFIFGLSATHFTRLYFISANNEVFMLFFVLLYLILFLTEKKTYKNCSTIIVDSRFAFKRYSSGCSHHYFFYAESKLFIYQKY